MKISHDVNGNKIVTVNAKDLKTWRVDVIKGFSIQTLNNLPMTHNEGITFTTNNEIFHHINEHGTKRQKKLVGCDQDLTLADFINGYTYKGDGLFKSLSENDINQLVNIIGGRSKDRLHAVLEYHLNSNNFWGVESRFMYDYKNDKWSYCAGQDYTSEMREVRKAMLK